METICNKFSALTREEQECFELLLVDQTTALTQPIYERLLALGLIAQRDCLLFMPTSVRLAWAYYVSKDY